MKKRTYILPVSFVALSSSALILGIYLIATKATLHPQFFITVCGEVLKNVSEHVHFNPDGVLSSLILLITVIGVGLTVIQAVGFILSHKRLSGKLLKADRIPEKLSDVIQEQHLQNVSISIVEGKPTAYTIGLFQPRIVVSTSLIQKASRKQLEAVILHELYHLQNRHLFWLLISRLISSLFFFIPIIEYLAQQLKIEFELTADSYVINKQKTRDHLCGSLALNLQYAGGVIPHFATSPIENRVAFLLSQPVSLDKVDMMRVCLSLFSVTVMIGLALIQPSQIAASFHEGTSALCRIGQKCQNKDCSDQLSVDRPTFTPFAPASFSLSSSPLTISK